MPRRRAPAPTAPAPGQVWLEMKPRRALSTGEGARGSFALVYIATERELWIRSVGKRRRNWGDDSPTVKGDSVRGERIHRIEIYAHRVRPPRWQLAAGRTAPPPARGRRRRVDRCQLHIEV